MSKFFYRSLLAATLLVAGACDQQDERQRRASVLLDAVVEQLEASEGAGGPGPLERATPDERAIAGALNANARAQIAAENARFAVGSIIVKPRTVERLQRAVREQSPQRAIAEREESAIQEQADTPPTPRPVARAPATQKSRDRPLASPPPLAPPELRIEELPAEALQPRIMEAMITAQSDAVARMDNLGLEGTVTRTVSGNLVIDMFASASQLTDGATPGPQFALEAAFECPDMLDVEAMRADKTLATNCMIEQLKASGEYEYVEKDYIFDHQFARRPTRTPGDFLLTPDDTLWALQWHFGNNGTEPGQSLGGAGFVDFWTRQQVTGSPDVTVAVVDTGLALRHPDIENSENIVAGWDMVTDPAMGNDGDSRDSNPDDPGDLCNPNLPGAADSFHGTHVAGTIGAAATNNGAGVAGGAWNVRIVPVRALGKCGGRLSDINDAILWAAGIIPAEGPGGEPIFNQNPADIINLSIGLAEACPASMQDAINTAVDRGAIVVAAAGNARRATAAYAPGGCNNVITVAAGDARGHIAPYSNFGPGIDILAPGGDLSRDDNQDGHPDGVLSTRPSSNCYDPLTGDEIANCNYAFEQGTSMAAPHVSAALALISAKNPEMTGPQLQSTLMSTLMPRDGDQCTASCADYPDATEIPERPGICTRACGGLLNLGNLEPAEPAQ